MHADRVRTKRARLNTIDLLLIINVLSADVMKGVVETFNDSVTLHKVRVTNFIDDGDCKS